MMRGPSYDDAYISRKMSHLHGPTFSAPGPVSYGRPPIGGYLQEPYSYDYVPRRSQTNTTGVAKARSLSQEVPYLWPEVDNNLKERRSRKGWYRVDFGPQQSTELRYLPTSRDKLNFLRSYAEPVSYSAFDLPRATSVPPPARKSRKSGSSTYWTTTRYRPITTVIPYTRPRSSSYSYWYYPSLRPYWSSLWTSPRYLNPIAGRARSLSPPIRVSTSWSGYAPLGPPPPRMVPRMPPAYYDYDYGYGGYYGYAPPPPRISRYDSYLDDDLPEPAYVPRYRPRLPDPLDDADFRDRAPAAPSATRAVTTADGDDSLALVPARGRTGSRLRPHLQSVPRQEVVPGETEGERHLARLAHRYPSLSEPQMLQDHVDKMRIRLKSLAYSLDPTGPVPEIILPDRHKKSGALDDKKYSSALEFKELPKLASRRQRYYPEDEHMKDNLRIQCLSHYKTTRTAADAQVRGVMPDSSSRYTKLTSKWEEPDTVFGAPTDKKPYSKAITDGATEEGSEERKERRKKKKSKERELAPETSAVEAPADVSEVEPVSAPTESEPAAAAANGEPGADDDKERKKLEKKKRKAEREAAAKAAMEAELAALAAAEAELARLEAESSSLKPDAPAPEVSAPVEVAPAEPAAEVKSESAAEKCESSREVVCEVVCVTPETLGELAPSTSPLQLPPQEEQVPQLTEEPQAIHEPQQAEEPPVEPQLEPTVQEPQVEEPQVETPVEEPQVETPVEPPVEEPPLEEAKAEEVQMKPPAEVPQPKIAQVEEPQVEEPQVEPPVEEPQVVEPQTEPPVEAQTEAAYVEESVAVVEEPPRMVVRRAAGGDDDAGWLDAWAGEEAAAGAAEETGQHLGTEVSDDLATTTIRAEAGQEEPDAAADADAAAAAADTLTTGVTPTRLGEEPLQ